MNAAFSAVMEYAPLAAALFCLVTLVLNRPLNGIHLAAAALTELGLLAFVVLAIVRLATGGHPAGGVVTFVFYLVGSPLVLPVGVVWGLVDRSRWSSAVVGVAFLVVPVLIVRINQVWSGA